MVTDVIILNRMYVGDYLGENIGHEVINLIKPDNNQKYGVYINHDGRISNNFLKTDDDIKWNATHVLFTRWCTREYKNDKKESKSLSMIEILAKTEGELECILENTEDDEKSYNNYLKKLKNITYGKKHLVEIFNKNVHNGNPIYVTFRTNKIIKVQNNKRLFIIDSPISKNTLKKIKKENEDIIDINKGCYKKNSKGKIQNVNFAKASLKQYIVNGEYDKDKNLSKVYNNLLENIIKNSCFWEKDAELLTYKQLEKSKLITTDVKKNNFIAIVKQEYDELTYTNLFFHIFKSNPKLFCDFAKKILNITVPLDPKKLRFVREDGNVDLLIDYNDKDNDDKKTLIVIENKIKSGINGIRHNEIGEEVGNQLCKYVLYTFGKKVKKGSDKHGYTYENFSEKECEIKNYKDYLHRHFYIFSPDYKHFNEQEINKNIKEMLKNYTKYENNKDMPNKKQERQIRKSAIYKIITYRQIYNFLKKYKFNKKYPKPTYYNEFLYAIERHSCEVDNIQERQMFERFAERIKEIEPNTKGA